MRRSVAQKGFCSPLWHRLLLITSQLFRTFEANFIYEEKLRFLTIFIL